MTEMPADTDSGDERTQDDSEDGREVRLGADTGLSRLTPEEMDTVTMEVTVDVSDMDERDQRLVRRLADQYEAGFEEVVAKSRDYGWSFIHTAHKLARSEATPLDDDVRMATLGLMTRIGDKRERLLENVYGNGDATVSDTADVTAAEAANYYMMMAVLLAEPSLAAQFVESDS